MAIVFTMPSCDTADRDNGQGKALLETARNDYMVGDYIACMKSLHEYITASNAGEIAPDPETDIQIYKFLGNIHYVYQDYAGAIKNYELGLLKGKDLDDSTEKLKLLYNLGLIYGMQQDSVKTLSYISQMRNLRNADVGLSKFFTTVSEGSYELQFGDEALGADKFGQSLHIIEDYNLDTYLKFTPYSVLYSYYEENGEFTKALDILKKYEKELEKTSESPNSKTDCLKGFMSVYTKLGDRENATYYQTRYMQVSDSLMSHSRFIKAKEDFHKHNERVTDTTITALKSTINTQHITLYAGLAIMCGCIGFWIAHSRHKRKRMMQRTENLPFDREPTRHPELFRQIKSVIDDPSHYSDPDFSIEKLAAATGSNVKYVSQAIHDNTGTNFRTFLNNRRIAGAKHILDHEGTSVAVADVGRRVGFLSQSAFIAAFKRVTGTTPSKYQRRTPDTKTDDNFKG